MPEYTPYAHIKIPLWGEPDQVPVDLKDAFTTIDPLLVLRASDEADRDSRYADVPLGTIVTGTDEKAIWRKEADGWSIVWQDTGWTTVSLMNGWTNVQSNNPVAYRLIGNIAYWKGILRWPDAEDYAGETWITIANLPSEAQPVGGEIRFPWSAGTTGMALALALRIAEGSLQGWGTRRTGAYMPVPGPYVVEGV